MWEIIQRKTPFEYCESFGDLVDAVAIEGERPPTNLMDEDLVLLLQVIFFFFFFFFFYLFFPLRFCGIPMRPNGLRLRSFWRPNPLTLSP
jgi:hypothetical protein